ncbi:hypothetical protein LMG9964_06202 [Paraburkholderia phenoliruptrix]|uniref:Uncharacterized protein n=1 Tax=Paraburkholderia phenoliruptrix TaxID=252970 RepID=A0A6J5KGX6_9BURK|nr:hypothetical protein LMG9964_06202 [Paraburkholderia phenoliruptrix]
MGMPAVSGRGQERAGRVSLCRRRRSRDGAAFSQPSATRAARTILRPNGRKPGRRRARRRVKDMTPVWFDWYGSSTGGARSGSPSLQVWSAQSWRSAGTHARIGVTVRPYVSAGRMEMAGSERMTSVLCDFPATVTTHVNMSPRHGNAHRFRTPVTSLPSSARRCRNGRSSWRVLHEGNIALHRGIAASQTRILSRRWTNARPRGKAARN